MLHLFKLVTMKVWHGVYLTIVISSSAAMITQSMMMDRAARVDEFMYRHLQADDEIAKMFTRQQIIDLRTKGFIELSEPK